MRADRGRQLRWRERHGGHVVCALRAQRAGRAHPLVACISFASWIGAWAPLQCVAAYAAQDMAPGCCRDARQRAKHARACGVTVAQQQQRSARASSRGARLLQHSRVGHHELVGGRQAVRHVQEGQRGLRRQEARVAARRQRCPRRTPASAPKLALHACCAPSQPCTCLHPLSQVLVPPEAAPTCSALHTRITPQQSPASYVLS